jgi:uncharacterized SAM-binding protein YcdF (DUF218 family)
MRDAATRERSSRLPLRRGVAWKLLACVGIPLLLLLWGWISWADWPDPGMASLPATADAIVVLGGGGEERVRETCRLFKEKRSEKVIVTGDGGLIVASLLKCGVPAASIVHETAASSTIENARNVKPLLMQLQAKSAILVTTWTHARRAQRIFENEIPGLGFSAAYEQRPAQELNEWQADEQRRERIASIYCLLRHGIWCF